MKVASAFVLAVCMMLAARTVAQASEPPKVAFVVLDGWRASERDNPSLTPEFNGYVRNLGAFVHVVMDADGCAQSATTFSQATWASGTCQRLGGDISGDTHADMPYLWEYLRKQFGYTEAQCAVLSGKDRLRMMDASTHPDYGQPFRAFFHYVPYHFAGWDGDDIDTYAYATSYILANDPRLVWIDLSQSDRGGHRAAGNWDVYLSHLAATDHYGRLMVDFLLANGYTYVVVLTDHGRHNDDLLRHGPGAGHPDDCPGCQFVFAQMAAKGDRTWRTPVLSHDTVERVNRLAAKGDALFDCTDSAELDSEILTLGGWMNHGCDCSGCINIFVEIIGPNVVVGESPVTHSQLDLLPTLRELMAQLAPDARVDMPYAAEGGVMTEIFSTTSVPTVTPYTEQSTWGNLKSLYR